MAILQLKGVPEALYVARAVRRGCPVPTGDLRLARVPVSGVVVKTIESNACQSDTD